MRLLSSMVAMLLAMTGVARAAPLGGYRFGMTPEQVKQVQGCGEYKPIGQGDLECPAFELGGKKRNLSFHFRDRRLEKLQVWFAESAPRAAAEAAADELLAFLSQSYGELESPVVAAGAAVTRPALFTALEKLPSGELAKVQLKPKKGPADAFVFASIIRSPEHGHYVFLYFQPPRAP